jgi:hypothetical protein
MMHCSMTSVNAAKGQAEHELSDRADQSGKITRQSQSKQPVAFEQRRIRQAPRSDIR